MHRISNKPGLGQVECQTIPFLSFEILLQKWQWHAKMNFSGYLSHKTRFMAKPSGAGAWLAWKRKEANVLI